MKFKCTLTPFILQKNTLTPCIINRVEGGFWGWIGKVIKLSVSPIWYMC